MAAPISGTQAPGYYRIKVGDYEVTQIADGARTFPMPDTFVVNQKKEDALAAAEGAYMPKGQVTIPAEIRERAGLLPETEVEFEFDGEVVRIVRAKARKRDGRGARLVAHLRGRGDIAMSTDAIMALTRND